MLRSRFHRIFHDRNYLLRLLIVAVIWYIVCNVGVKGMNHERDWFMRGTGPGEESIAQANLEFYNDYFDLDYDSLEELIEDFAIPYLQDSPNHILINMMEDGSVIVALIFLAPLLIGTGASRKSWQLGRYGGKGRVRIVLSAVFELAVMVFLLNAVLSLLMLLFQLIRTEGAPYNAIHTGLALRYFLLRPLVLLAICGVSVFLVFLFQGSFFSCVLTLCLLMAESFVLVRCPEILQKFMPIYYLTDLDLFGRAAPDVALVLQAVAVCLGVILLWSAASIFVLYIRDIRRIED